MQNARGLVLANELVAVLAVERGDVAEHVSGVGDRQLGLRQKEPRALHG